MIINMIKTNLYIKIRRRYKTRVAGPESFNKDLTNQTLSSKTVMVIIIMKVKIAMAIVKIIKTTMIMV